MKKNALMIKNKPIASHRIVNTIIHLYTLITVAKFKYIYISSNPEK